MSTEVMFSGHHTCIVCGDVAELRVKNPVVTRCYCAICWGILSGLDSPEAVTSIKTPYQLRNIIKHLKETIP